MTRRQVLLVVAAGWMLFVLGVGLLPVAWAYPAAIALAGLGLAVIGLFGVEVKT